MKSEKEVNKQDYKHKKCSQCGDLMVHESCESKEEKGFCIECYADMSEFYDQF